MLCRIQSEGAMPVQLRLKIEINCKGRDLLDLYLALTQTEVDTDDVIRCYKRYISFTVQQPPTHRQFILNMEEKMQEQDFLTDSQLLLRPGLQFDPHQAYEVVRTKLIDKLLK